MCFATNIHRKQQQSHWILFTPDQDSELSASFQLPLRNTNQH